VYRYALERWAPAAYRVVVLAAGGLEASDPRLAGLTAPVHPAGGLAPADPAAGRPPLALELVDASRSLPQPLEEAWTAHGRRGPLAVVFYPPSSPAFRESGGASVAGRVAHVTPLVTDTGALLRSSPARTAIGGHLVAGATLVWVLLEGRDAAANATARRTLEESLARAAATIRPPAAAELGIDPSLLARVRIPLAARFPLVAVPRHDPREAFLVDCLLGSEEDLRGYDEPIAFPVFGRGVVLHALVGRGITAENVAAAHDFITGACTCVVKEGNPGFDLPLDVAWDDAVGDLLLSDPPVAAGAAPRLIQIPPGRR